MAYNASNPLERRAVETLPGLVPITANAIRVTTEREPRTFDHPYSAGAAQASRIND